MSKQRFWYGVLIVILGVWSTLELGLVYRLALDQGWAPQIVSTRSDGDPDGRWSDLYQAPPDPTVFETRHWAADGVYVAQGPTEIEHDGDPVRVIVWTARERVGWPFRTAEITSYWNEVLQGETAGTPLPEVGGLAPEPHVRVKPTPVLPGVLLGAALHTALIGLGVLAVRRIMRKRARTQPVADTRG